MLFPGCMFSVAMIQRLRLPPATKAMLADLHGEPAAGEQGARPALLPGPGAEPAPRTRLQGSYRTLMTFSVKGSGGAPSS